MQRILGLTWKDKTTHSDILQRLKTTTIESQMAKQHLRWLGHTIRMPEVRLPRQILYGQLAEGTRNAGGPRKRFKDHSKNLLKKGNVPPTALENLAADRPTWRRTCNSVVSQMEGTFANNRNEKRRRRHQRALGIIPAENQHPCHLCDKICGSRIGLHAHLRWHQRR